MVMDLIKVVNTLLDQCTYTRITQDPETFYAMLTHSIFLQYDRTQNHCNSLYCSVPTSDFFFSSPILSFSACEPTAEAIFNDNNVCNMYRTK